MSLTNTGNGQSVGSGITHSFWYRIYVGTILLQFPLVFEVSSISGSSNSELCFFPKNYIQLVSWLVGDPWGINWKVQVVEEPMILIQPTSTHTYCTHTYSSAHTLASFPGSSAWAERKEPGTHCLRMLSSPRISGNLEIFRKICSVTLTSARYADFSCIKDACH